MTGNRGDGRIPGPGTRVTVRMAAGPVPFRRPPRSAEMPASRRRIHADTDTDTDTDVDTGAG